MSAIVALKELGSKMRVLLVDDDSDIREKLGVYFSKIFKEVIVAGDGVEGLERYRTGAYDIVITDISMPVMDGIEMARGMKQINPQQELLVVSAFSDFNYLSEAISLGVSGYLLKPINYDVITQELYKIVYKLHVFRENERYKEQLESMVKEKTDALEKLQKERVADYDMTLRSMVEMIEDRDTYTAGHSQRVASYCVRIAKQMGYDTSTCNLLYQAGILHDLGKIATPDSILLNPQKLNEVEYALIQEHVKTGFALLNKIPMFQRVAEIIRYHHERYDGTGYPEGLKAEAIPELSRIMIVADAFDAMTTNRIYKGRKSVAEAIAEIKLLREQQFHPEVVDAALEVLQHVTIDASINQLPQSDLEKERFAYFYRDTVSGVHNRNYLEVILRQNSREVHYTIITTIYLHHFSSFNEKMGWECGDILLRSIGTTITELLDGALAFRVHGDDFVILSDKAIAIEPFQKRIMALLSDGVDVSIHTYPLEEKIVTKILQDIENL